MSVRSFRDLIVWQRSRELSRAVYQLTASFPREELYGLTSQLRRAAVSIMSNIAEGHGRGTRAQLVHFLCIARGSSFEVQSQLILAADLGYGNAEQIALCDDLAAQVGRMLYSTLDSIRKRDSPNL